jgi:serine/threonine protein kinase
MAKADESWAKEQSKQVVTEIESLKQIRHPNVMKLYAYNLNAKYPTSTARKIDTILLVLEFAPGGEIFDILYYTNALEDFLARTYFRQSIFGLEACHNAGVAHRDIKPQNLLLDSRFNIKITDFGLSKVFESDADAIMKTTYVGTKGYQAPELLLDRPYDLACDIFSMGVVLFILITGYPPFEQAHVSDRWFKPLATGNFAKFWKYHHGCAISNDKHCKDLLQRMFAYDPKQRITIAQIKKHPWFCGKYLEGKDLIRALRHRHRAMEMKRKNDSRKIKDLNQSILPDRPLPGCERIRVPLFPLSETEGIYDTYTTCAPVTFVNGMNHLINLYNGKAVLNEACTGLECRLRIMSANTNSVSKANEVAFAIDWWQSREYVHQSTCDPTAADDVELEHSHAIQEAVYLIRMRRVEGSLTIWQSIRKLLFKKASHLFTGLPAWAEHRQSDPFASALKEMDNRNNYEIEDDEYDDIEWTEAN